MRTSSIINEKSWQKILAWFTTYYTLSSTHGAYQFKKVTTYVASSYIPTKEEEVNHGSTFSIISHVAPVVEANNLKPKIFICIAAIHAHLCSPSHVQSHPQYVEKVFHAIWLKQSWLTWSSVNQLDSGIYLHSFRDSTDNCIVVHTCIGVVHMHELRKISLLVTGRWIYQTEAPKRQPRLQIGSSVVCAVNCNH